MTRYYFYQADYYLANPANPAADREGGVHGIWVVEDESTPDLILASVEKWLYEDWERQSPAPQQQGQTASTASISFVIKQFNSVV